MYYFPEKDKEWETISPQLAGFDETRLRQAIDFVETHESPWPRDLENAEGLPGMTQVEKPPWNEILGPIKPRGSSNGLLLKEGRIVAQWGDVARADMSFSVAKSYLAILAGIAGADGLIADIDHPVGQDMPGDFFVSEHNRSISWRHLLCQTSEWEGTLWEKPERIDRNRQVGPGADNSRKGEPRPLQSPGTFWEYNDVRVNLLSLALLYRFRRPLPEVLRARIMNPIGASDDWRWFGYRNSFVEIDGRQMQSVPGGTHWGGGLQMNSLDHARFALLMLRNGVWHTERLLSQSWLEAIRQPGSLNTGYGLLWWLNTDQREWPGAPQSSYAAVGAGANILWIDPEHDLVLVARWVDSAKVAEFIAHLVASLA